MIRYPLFLLGFILVVWWACSDRPVRDAPPTTRTRHVLLLSNTQRADSLANTLRRQLASDPLPARLSDLSRPDEPLPAIYARLPWALQQGVDVFILDLPVTGTAADTLLPAIEALIRRANSDVRLLTPDSLRDGRLLLY